MAAAHEKVRDIEREIRVVKYCEQAIMNTLTFRAVPKQVLIKLVYFTALWVNNLP